MTREEFDQECKTRDTDPLWLAARDWIHSHPHVWRWLITRAMIPTEQGRRFSFKSLVESVRWTVVFEHDEKWKLNNTHTAYLAREFVRLYPQALELVELRRSPGSSA